jgi:hypothetical protein
VLYLVIVPAAIVAVIWALASIGGPQARRRYRPGRRYEFTPVWYLANHRREPDPDRGGQRRELTAGEGGGAVQGTTGGASDRW